MAPPAPISCSAPDCPFTTADGIPTYELVIRSMENHGYVAHPPPARQGVGGEGQQHGGASKAEKRSARKQRTVIGLFLRPMVSIQKISATRWPAISGPAPVIPQHYKPRAEWRLTMEQRELALARRYVKQEQVLKEHTKTLAPLQKTDVVLVQIQTGRHALKWDKSGTVLEVLPYDQYRIKMDGSGRVSLRNRRFLKKIKPFSSSRSLPNDPVIVPSEHQSCSS